MNKIELQISQFIDDELSDESQKELFEILAADKGARKTLSDFMRLKKEISALHAGTTVNIPRNIPFQKNSIIDARHDKKYRAPFIISVAAAVVLTMLLFINRVENQNGLIQLSSLQKKYISLMNENSILIKSAAVKTGGEKSASAKSTPGVSRNKNTTGYIAGNIRSFTDSDQMRRIARISEMIEANKSVITKDDFIGGQIVGN
ncbi:MAG: hypothetical protein WC061_02490 [Melioribacteraceae bacterium]